MASPRVHQLEDRIKVVVAEMLERRIKDPRLGFITITDVSLTGDSRDAKIFYTVLGDDNDLAGTEAALKSATGLLRSTVGKRLALRYAPTLTFVPDLIPQTSREFEELLNKAKERDAELAAQAAQGQYAGETDPYRKPHEDDELEDESDNEKFLSETGDPVEQLAALEEDDTAR